MCTWAHLCVYMCTHPPHVHCCIPTAPPPCVRGEGCLLVYSEGRTFSSSAPSPSYRSLSSSPGDSPWGGVLLDRRGCYLMICESPRTYRPLCKSIPPVIDAAKVNTIENKFDFVALLLKPLLQDPPSASGSCMNSLVRVCV